MATGSSREVSSKLERPNVKTRFVASLSSIESVSGHSSPWTAGGTTYGIRRRQRFCPNNKWISVTARGASTVKLHSDCGNNGLGGEKASPLRQIHLAGGRKQYAIVPSMEAWHVRGNAWRDMQPVGFFTHLHQSEAANKIVLIGPNILELRNSQPELSIWESDGETKRKWGALFSLLFRGGEDARRQKRRRNASGRALNTKANTNEASIPSLWHTSNPFLLLSPFLVVLASQEDISSIPWTHSALFAKSLDKQSLRLRLTGSISLEKRIEPGVFNRSPWQLSFRVTWA